MKLSDVRAVKDFCESLDSCPNWREVLEESKKSDDFDVDNVRFIEEDTIDSVQQEELESDLYILGCFNDWFLADVLELDIDVIKALQKAEAFEAIGKMVLSMGKLEELQEEYSRLDGYGHHFNGYDSSEHYIAIGEKRFYVFDNR